MFDDTIPAGSREEERLHWQAVRELVDDRLDELDDAPLESIGDVQRMLQRLGRLIEFTRKAVDRKKPVSSHEQMMLGVVLDRASAIRSEAAAALARIDEGRPAAAQP